jgi:DNA-directed RNA polymerase specialized sigma24 family protein
MSNRELGAEWILSSSSCESDSRPLHKGNELITAAQRVWPRVRAIALKQIKNQNFEERVALAAQIWERALQSVSKTLERHGGKESSIVDLEAYLAGAFYHRFNRFLRQERRRHQAVELVPFSQDLEQFPGALDADAEHDLDRIVQVKEAVENMDDWTRNVWTARQYGYSWREIAEHKGLSEQQAKLRFQYAIRRLRDRLEDDT